jgi:hypothetical protein
VTVGIASESGLEPRPLVESDLTSTPRYVGDRLIRDWHGVEASLEQLNQLKAQARIASRTRSISP